MPVLVIDRDLAAPDDVAACGESAPLAHAHAGGVRPPTRRGRGGAAASPPPCPRRRYGEQAARRFEQARAIARRWHQHVAPRCV